MPLLPPLLLRILGFRDGKKLGLDPAMGSPDVAPFARLWDGSFLPGEAGEGHTGPRSPTPPPPRLLSPFWYFHQGSGRAAPTAASDLPGLSSAGIRPAGLALAGEAPPLAPGGLSDRGGRVVREASAQGLALAVCGGGVWFLKQGESPL